MTERGTTHLYDPIDLGPVRVRNRVAMSVHGTRLSQKRYLRYLAERAAGGAGLIGLPAGYGVGVLPFGPGRSHSDLVGDFDAVPIDPLSKEGVAHFDRVVIPMLAAQADVVHEHGARCVGQLHHAGASRNDDDLQPAVGPSDVPDPVRRHVPHALSLGEIERVVAAFAEGARRVVAAGVDGVEIHAAHGYLLQQFLSPATNHRHDAYGGDLDARFRLLGEVVEAVRSAAGAGAVVGVRLSGSEAAGGYDLRQTIEVARRLEALGVGYLNISGGTYTGYSRGLHAAYVGSIYEPEAVNAEASRAVRAAVGVPVIATGRIPDLDVAARLVASGDADLAGLVRAWIAEPQLVAKSRARGSAPIAPTLGCNECHVPGRAVVCATNPAAGKEAEFDAARVARARRLLVVGAGPAGVEAAVRAAARGHRVALWERANEVGGAVALLGRDPHRPQYARYARYLAERVAAAGVELELGVEATFERILSNAPDAVVLAVGADELRPAVPGLEQGDVHTALDVLRGAQPGRRVVVVAGLDDHVGPLAIADLLAARGHEVELVAESLTVGEGIEPATLYALTARLLRANVRLHPLTRLCAVEPRAARVEHVWTAESRVLALDSLVLVCGRRSRTELGRSLAESGIELHEIGDALAPRRILHATHDGARLGATID